MGAKQSTGARGRSYSSSGEGPVVTSNGAGVSVTAPGPSGTGADGARSRTRSLGSVHHSSNGHPLRVNSHNLHRVARGAATPDSDSSSPEDQNVPFPRSFMQASSLPVHLFAFHTGIKCPVCNKFVPPDDIECHLVMCLTKPRITYNEDVLTEDKGECVICLDELQQGETIARLPCLCVYHKNCIDDWFKVNRSCPEHPSD